MERLSNLQPLPAGIPVDSETERQLSQSSDFVRREDGSYRFAVGSPFCEWSLVGTSTKASPTIQALRLAEGGVVFWYSGIHTGEALFEYKRAMSAVPSRRYKFASVL